MTELGMPHSREAEEAVLGAVLISQDCFHEARVIIPAGGEEFYLHRCRFIWQAYERLVEKNSPIDLLLVSEELNKKGQLDEIGGPAYLMSLINQTPTTLHTEAYAGIIHEKHVRRQMITTANKIAEGAYSDKGMEQVAAESTAALNETVRMADKSRMTSIADAIRETDDQITERGKLEEKPGIPTGLIDLDNAFGGGLQNGSLYLVSCRPGGGKTSLMLQIAQNAARYATRDKSVRKSVAIFELEMSKEQIVRRMISQRSGIDSQLLQTGRIPDDKYNEYYEALDWISGLDIHLDDTPSATPSYMRSQCEILASRGQLDLLILDYLGLARPGFRIDSAHERMDYICQEVKSIAREFNIPALAAHQMNRSIEKRDRKSKPLLSDLNEGGEKDPDTIFFVHHELNEDEKPTGKAELVIAKNREGPLIDIPVIWMSSRAKFESAVRMKL